MRFYWFYWSDKIYFVATSSGKLIFRQFNKFQILQKYSILLVFFNTEKNIFLRLHLCSLPSLRISFANGFYDEKKIACRLPLIPENTEKCRLFHKFNKMVKFLFFISALLPKSFLTHNFGMNNFGLDAISEMKNCCSYDMSWVHVNEERGERESEELLNKYELINWAPSNCLHARIENSFCCTLSVCVCNCNRNS